MKKNQELEKRNKELEKRLQDNKFLDNCIEMNL